MRMSRGAAWPAVLDVPRRSLAILIFWTPRASKPPSSISSPTNRASSTSRPKGPTKVSVILQGGIRADLRVVSDTEFPFALAYFTGSKGPQHRHAPAGDPTWFAHSNEYGLFKSDVETRDPKLLMPCRTEGEIFEKLGLDYIPPELREDAANSPPPKNTPSPACWNGRS